ncbi:hypothetical protein IAU60_005088 [Kwoniella sp. DSM 27419]
MRAVRMVQPVFRRSVGQPPLRPVVSGLATRTQSTTILSAGASQARQSSQLTPRNDPTSHLGYPSESEYSRSTVYALSYMSRIIRYVLYGILAVGGVSIATFEGLHIYVEKVCMAAPSRDDGNADDPYGWISENQGWTGGIKGGTDPRLGQKARHALRGAWICQQWGAGGSASSTIMGKSAGSSLHPEFAAARGMIGAAASVEQSGAVNRPRVDRGYELADEYIDLAIREAKKKGLVFPPQLSVLRPVGPPTVESTHAVPQGDPAVLDLLLLKAGVLERINTPDSLGHAKDLYEQVLSSLVNVQAEQTETSPARTMRLAGKVGDLSARTGANDEAMQWWSWGLARAGVEMHKGGKVSEVVEEVKKEAKGWFASRSTKASESAAPAPLPPVSPISPSIDLSPPVLRSAVSLLVSASAHLATQSSLSSAAALQTQALSLIPASTSLSSPTSTSADATLHATWLQQRAALLRLHQGSVMHAQHPKSTSAEPLRLITAAQEISETIVSNIQTMPSAYTTPRSSALAGPAKVLRRDALLTGAEASYTRAVLLERNAASLNQDDKLHQLELAAEGFERAMTLSAIESGVEKKDGDEVGQGEDWGRYWRGYARVRGKLGPAVEGTKT